MPRKRVERLVRQAAIQGIYRRRRRGCTRRDPAAHPVDDLVNRVFDPLEPDRLWMMDVTQHPADDGQAYLAVVLDAFSRMVVGWAIADHMRADLVVDALQMALWRRQPPTGRTVAHSDHGALNTPRGRSGVAYEPPGCSLRWAPSGTPFDNSVVERFFSTLRTSEFSCAVTVGAGAQARIGEGGGGGQVALQHQCGDARGVQFCFRENPISDRLGAPVASSSVRNAAWVSPGRRSRLRWRPPHLSLERSWLR